MNYITRDGIHYDLAGIEKDCWYRLQNGALQGRNPFHSGVVANQDHNGASVRTVVLRHTNPIDKALTFFTDTRSRKWQALAKDARLSWLFYDAVTGIQITLSGITALHQSDALAETAWKEQPANSRINYLAALPPSTPSTTPVSGPAVAAANDVLSIADTEAGSKNFGVVVTQVKRMEWLWLHREGNVRAAFTYADNAVVNSCWLVP